MVERQNLNTNDINFVNANKSPNFSKGLALLDCNVFIENSRLLERK